MTSNIGSREVAERGVSVGFATLSQKQHATTESEYRKHIERAFSPEFINRIDETILFAPLSASCAERIVHLEVEALRKRLRKLGYHLRITTAARRRLAQLGFSERYGARAIRRTVMEYIEEPIASMLIAKEIAPNSEIVIGATKGNIAIRQSRAMAV